MPRMDCGAISKQSYERNKTSAATYCNETCWKINQCYDCDKPDSCVVINAIFGQAPNIAIDFHRSGLALEIECHAELVHEMSVQIRSCRSFITSAYKVQYFLHTLLKQGNTS